MSRRRRVYRVYDSRGTVEVCVSRTRASRFRSSGYPVEVWSVEPGQKNQLYQLDGGRGPEHLRGAAGSRVADFDDIREPADAQ